MKPKIGLADKSMFHFFGFEWVRLVGGWIIYLGLSPLFVAYVGWWTNE